MNFSEPIRFEEAAKIAEQKQLLPTSLSSARISSLDADLKRRAAFSARLTLADPLQTLKDNLELIVSGDRDEYGRLRSIPEAKAQLRESLIRSGYLPPEGKEGSILDHLSDARRQLIVETNVLDTLNAGRWMANQDQDVLDVNPGWELVRMIDSRVPRDWAERWQAAGGEFFDGGRMIALKNDPVWQALGDGEGGYDDTLGNPWAPFAFNSGMSTIDVPRDECVALGLMEEGDRVEPVEGPDLNDNLEASTARFDEAMQKQLAEDPDLQIKDGVLTLAGNEAAHSIRNFLRSINTFDNNQPRDPNGRWTKQDRDMQAKRGLAAVKTSIRLQKDSISAMHDPVIGPIDFLWVGRGDKGIKKIIADHGIRAALAAPQVIAHRDSMQANGNNLVIQKGIHKVILTRSVGKDRRHWMLTSYEVGSGQKNRRSVNSGKDLIPQSLRSPELHWPRSEEVAIAGFNIAQFKGRLQALLSHLRRAA